MKSENSTGLLGIYTSPIHENSDFLPREAINGARSIVGLEAGFQYQDTLGRSWPIFGSRRKSVGSAGSFWS